VAYSVLGTYNFRVALCEVIHIFIRKETVIIMPKILGATGQYLVAQGTRYMEFVHPSSVYCNICDHLIK